jgi:hypothetical protein
MSRYLLRKYVLIVLAQVLPFLFHSSIVVRRSVPVLGDLADQRDLAEERHPVDVVRARADEATNTHGHVVGELGELVEN